MKLKEILEIIILIRVRILSEVLYNFYIFNKYTFWKTANIKDEKKDLRLIRLITISIIPKEPVQLIRL